MIVKTMNGDIIQTIFTEHGIDGLIKAVQSYVDYRYEQAYRDGYIMGQGIGYQDGKYNGYVKAINEIMKAK